MTTKIIQELVGLEGEKSKGKIMHLDYYGEDMAIIEISERGAVYALFKERLCITDASQLQAAIDKVKAL